MSGIPMQGRLTQFDGGQIVSNFQNAPLLAQARDLQSRQIGAQNLDMNDAVMARAVTKGQAGPAEWDQAMQEAAAAGAPEAAALVGQYNPLKAADMLSRIAPQAAAPGGARGGETIASMASGVPSIKGGGPAGSYNFDAVPEDVLKTRYEGIGTFIDMMRNKPNPTYQDLASTIDFLKANGHPEAENLMKGPDAINPLNFSEKIGPMLRNAMAIHDQLGQRFAPEQMGLPYQAAAPDRKVTMSEAGPVETSTPAGGGPATSRFVPVTGNANSAFLPRPAASAGGGGPSVADADPKSEFYRDESGRYVNISDATRSRLKYAVDYLRTNQKMIPQGAGKYGQHNRDLIQALAQESSEGTGGAGGDVANYTDIKADQRSLANLQKQADAVFAFEKNLKMNLDVVKKNMPEGAGSDLGPWINRWVQTGRTEFGSETVPPYVASILTAMNEYAKISEGATGAAGASVEARRQTNEMLNGNYSKGTVLAIMNNTIYPDLENRRQSFVQQLSEIRGRLKKSTGIGNAPASAPTDTDTPAPTDKKPSWYKGGQ